MPKAHHRRLKRLYLVAFAAILTIVGLSAGAAQAYADSAYAVYAPTKQYDSYTVSFTCDIGQIGFHDEGVLVECASIDQAIAAANNYLREEAEGQTAIPPQFEVGNWRTAFSNYGERTYYYKIAVPQLKLMYAYSGNANNADEYSVRTGVKIQGNGTSAGTLTFIRSNDIVENGTEGTIVSSAGKRYTGTIYADFESTPADPNVDASYQTPKWEAHADEVTKVIFDADIAPLSCIGWFSAFINCTGFQHLDRLDTSKVTAMDFMFSSCSSLKSLDVRSFNTSNVASMDTMFSGMDGINTLDISSFNTSKVSNMYYMFGGCKNLKKIYVGPRWSTSKVTTQRNGRNMFINDTNLRGSSGTTCQAKSSAPVATSVYDIGYAHVDGGTSNPGYLTFQGTPVAYGSFQAIPARVYFGAAITPKVTFSVQGKVLSEGQDYTLSYKNNINVGTATVVLTGKGNYSGTASQTFKIEPASLSSLVAMDIANQLYTGSTITPAVTVKYKGRALVQGTDYTVSYKNNVNTGSAAAKLVGTGNFRDTLNIPFKIVPAQIANASISTIENQVYTASQIKPTIRPKFNGKALRQDTDYIVSYKNNIDAGTATAIVKGIGNFSGTQEMKFKISPASASKLDYVSISSQKSTGSAIKPVPKIRYNRQVLKNGTDFQVSYTDNVKRGTAKVIIQLMGNYTGSRTMSFTIC